MIELVENPAFFVKLLILCTTRAESRKQFPVLVTRLERLLEPHCQNRTENIHFCFAFETFLSQDFFIISEDKNRCQPSTVPQKKSRHPEMERRLLSEYTINTACLSSASCGVFTPRRRFLNKTSFKK